MAVRVTQHVIESLVSYPTPSPTTPTGVGVTQHVLESLVLDSDANACVTQHVLEMIVADNADGSHGDTGGGGSPAAATTTFGYAV